MTVEHPTPLHSVPSQPCSLYRFFDAHGELLYVGITDHLPGRLAEHQGEKEWWRDVAYVAVEHFGSRYEARVAEQAAIDAGRPIRNQVRSVGKTPIRSFRVPDEVYRPAQEKAAERGESLTDVVKRALERYAKPRKGES